MRLSGRPDGCSPHLVFMKPWAPSSAPHKPVVHTYYPTLRRPRQLQAGVHGHLWLHSEFEASLSYRTKQNRLDGPWFALAIQSHISPRLVSHAMFTSPVPPRPTSLLGFILENLCCSFHIPFEMAWPKHLS